MTSIGIPLYKYPTKEPNDDWVKVRKFAQVGRYVGTAVVNPSNGPGNTFDPVWDTTIKRNTAVGLRSLCYVPANYGEGDILHVLNEMKVWTALYQVPGYFIDEWPSDPAVSEDLMLQIQHRGPIKTLVVNPGTPINATNIIKRISSIVIYEGDYTGFQNMMDQVTIPDEIWKKAWVLVHGATVEEAFIVWQTCKHFQARYCYVTDIPYEQNPWNQLGNLFVENLIF